MTTDEIVTALMRYAINTHVEQALREMRADLAALVTERDALAERVGYLVAEAHGWQPKLEAAQDELARLQAATGPEETPARKTKGVLA